MTKETKFLIKRKDLIFNYYLKDDLSVMLKYNSLFGINEDYILFIPSILNLKDEWSVFNYRGVIQKSDLKVIRNSITWDYVEMCKNILNQYIPDFLNLFEASEIYEQKQFKFNLNVWIPISKSDKRKSKIIKILNIK